MIPAPRIAACLLGAGLLAGCSGIKTYPDSSPRNLFVKTEARSGSAFASVRVAVHIHQVDASCRTEYLGTVQLNEPTVEIGIPPGRQSYLVFNFYSSSFLGGSSGSINYETLLQPRAGYTYDASARYVDGLYHVVIRESRARGSAGREIGRAGLNECGRLPSGAAAGG
ncbi:MAG: hypothetical protein ACREUP_02590 [Burkholderiales bacterium]